MLVFGLGVTAAHAGSLVGKLELPAPPDRPPVATRGFLDRVENPLTKINPVNVAPYLVVVAEAEAPAPESSIQVSWELVGDSFGKPLLAVPAGAEVVIKNVTKTARSLVAVEDPKLIPGGPINPGGPKSFRTKEAKAYTITASDAPHIKAKLLVVTTPYVANIDDNGKFEIPELPGGTYKLRIYYFNPLSSKDGWLDRPDDAVVIPAKGKGEVTAKIPTGYPLKK
ncbi:MAG: hypothetical protein NT062_27430 [Proteobacteria bacterium]|nr:hypothetical protein [Pseudomonadota bacterium]